ncbi:hypothetical protein MJN51_40855, partial [Salmonella enterica subsp. enterica serovar Kentucky]|nr:hypothetical protein [Salmonella enterica subsp. enterica serovar Kentucky]
DFISQFRLDFGILGISGIDSDGSLLEFDYHEVRTKRAIIENSQLTIPESDYFIWITGEGKTVKRLSQCFEKGFDPHLVRAAAY